MSKNYISDNLTTKYRYEAKFILDVSKFNFFQDWLYFRTKLKKKFPTRIVNSLYLDDIKFSSMKDNIIGIPERSKKRFRWYVLDKKLSEVAFEEKIKKGKLGFKKTYKMQGPNKFQKSIELKKILNNYFSELKNNYSYFFKSPHFPVLLTSYHRSYFEDLEGNRVTLDEKIKFADLNIYSKINNVKKFNFNKKILEIKFDESNMNSIHNMVKDFDFIPQRNSKYLTGLALLRNVFYL